MSNLTELKQAIEELTVYQDSPRTRQHIVREDVLELLSEVTVEDVMEEYYSRATFTKEDMAHYTEDIGI